VEEEEEEKKNTPEAFFAAQPAATFEVAGRDEKTTRRASLAVKDE